MDHLKGPAPRLGILALLASLLVAGCVPTSPPMRFFVLTPIEASRTAGGAPDERSVLLGPLQMAAYLDRPQLMTRRSDGELILHELDRWAAPLEEMLVQTLADNLMRLTGSERILAYPTAGRAEAALRVTGQILRFDTDADGIAVLRVQWQVKSAAGDLLAPPQTAEYRAQAASADTAARVDALSKVLGQFAKDLEPATRGQSGKQ